MDKNAIIRLISMQINQWRLNQSAMMQQSVIGFGKQMNSRSVAIQLNRMKTFSLILGFKVIPFGVKLAQLSTRYRRTLLQTFEIHLDGRFSRNWAVYWRLLTVAWHSSAIIRDRLLLVEVCKFCSVDLNWQQLAALCSAFFTEDALMS